jgi:hypothetical protein
MERDKGVREDHYGKVLHQFTDILLEYRGPSVIPIDTLGIHGIFLTFRYPRGKKG